MGQDDEVLHRSGIKMDRYAGDIGMLTAFMQVLFHPTTGLFIHSAMLNTEFHTVLL